MEWSGGAPSPLCPSQASYRMARAWSWSPRRGDGPSSDLKRREWEGGGTVESISESIWEDHLRHTDRERAPHVDICILKRHRTMAPELSAISSMQAQNSSFIN